MSSKRSKGEFDYAGRAAAAEAARLAIRPAFRDVRDRNDLADSGTKAWLAAVSRFRASIDAAYPHEFWDDYDRLRRNDWSGLESAIRFLEADPFFFRSGYVKARLLRLVKRAPLDKAQTKRLRAVCLAAVDGRDRREFRFYCRLAMRLDDSILRVSLQERLGRPDEGVRRRAGWMRDALRRAEGR